MYQRGRGAREGTGADPQTLTLTARYHCCLLSARQKDRHLGTLLGDCGSVPFAGYQGSFHSVPSCFPYGDCYRPAEAAGGEALAGEAHPFHTLRPNGYSSLGAPLPATGKATCHLPTPSDWPLAASLALGGGHVQQRMSMGRPQPPKMCPGKPHPPYLA